MCDLEMAIEPIRKRMQGGTRKGDRGREGYGKRAKGDRYVEKKKSIKRGEEQGKETGLPKEEKKGTRRSLGGEVFVGNWQLANRLHARGSRPKRQIGRGKRVKIGDACMVSSK